MNEKDTVRFLALYGDTRLLRDGAWYVMGGFDELPISPPLGSRGEAEGTADAIDRLPAQERVEVLRHERPAPGAVWLVGGGREKRPPAV